MMHTFVCADPKITPEDLRSHILRMDDFRKDPEAARDALSGIKRLEEYMQGTSKEAAHTDLNLRKRSMDRFESRCAYRVGPTELVILDYVGVLQGRNTEHAMRRIVRTYMLTDKRIQMDKFRAYIDEALHCGVSNDIRDNVEHHWKDLVVFRERLKLGKN
jgi:hypothetical protein